MAGFTRGDTSDGEGGEDMGCCKCEELRWPDPQPTTYNETIKDNKGNIFLKEYCVFHAPKNNKQISTEEFNNLVLARISFTQHFESPNSTCVLSGAIFPGDIDFHKHSMGKHAPNINLEKSHFHGHANFISVVFCSNVNFISATFYQNADFHHADFKGIANFAHSHFQGKANFLNVQFHKTTYFESAKLSIRSNFSIATFHSNALFTNTTFNCESDFSSSVFKANTNFNNATFVNKSNFTNTSFFQRTEFNSAKFNGETNFKISKFYGIANFISAQFLNSISFEESKYSGLADFSRSLFHLTTNFNKTVFSNGVNFEHTVFSSNTTFESSNFSKKSKFTKCTFSKTSIFNKLQTIPQITFSDSDLSEVNITNTSLKNISFKNVIWGQTKFDVRHIISLEHMHAPTYIQTEFSSQTKATQLKSVEDFYRQMKKRLRDEQNDAEASLWHYAEKEVLLKLHRIQKPWSFQRIMLEIYRSISRYGEDPFQALEKLILFLILLFGVLSLAAFHENSGPQVEITISQVNKLFRLFGQYCLFDKIEGWRPPGIVDFCVLFLSRLLIPIQAAIFAFALRNKLHR